MPSNATVLYEIEELYRPEPAKPSADAGTIGTRQQRRESEGQNATRSSQRKETLSARQAGPWI